MKASDKFQKLKPKEKSCRLTLLFSLTHQAHVVCQYAPPDPLWPLLGREEGEAVVIEPPPLLPEGGELGAVLAGTHPGQGLLLVGHEWRAHQLKQTKPGRGFTVIKYTQSSHKINKATPLFSQIQLWRKREMSQLPDSAKTQQKQDKRGVQRRRESGKYVKATQIRGRLWIGSGQASFWEAYSMVQSFKKPTSEASFSPSLLSTRTSKRSSNAFFSCGGGKRVCWRYIFWVDLTINPPDNSDQMSPSRDVLTSSADSGVVTGFLGSRARPPCEP